MQQWEYMTWGVEDTFGYSGALIRHIDGEDADDSRSVYAALAGAGQEGWELVGVTQTEYRMVLVFKRPKA